MTVTGPGPVVPSVPVISRLPLEINRDPTPTRRRRRDRYEIGPCDHCGVTGDLPGPYQTEGRLFLCQRCHHTSDGPCDTPGCGARGFSDGPYQELRPGHWVCPTCLTDAWTSPTTTTGPATSTTPTATPTDNGLHAVDWTTFWTTDHRSGDWLIEPILPLGASVALYAQAGLGKSELVLAIAAAAATGHRILGRPPGDPICVLYLDFEGNTGELLDRLLDLGYGPDDNLTHLHYAMLPDLPPLDTHDGGHALLTLARHHNADLVIIDTLARVLNGGENDSDTLRAYHRHTGLTLRADSRTVLRVDHAGKDLTRGQRGTSAKNDDVDIVWHLARHDNGVRLDAKKRRNSWVPERITIDRHTDPLRYELTRRLWPAGTTELADQLDALDIPTTTGRPTIRKILRQAGIQTRNDVLEAAIRWRRGGWGSATSTISDPSGGSAPTEQPETPQRVHGSTGTGSDGQAPQVLGVTPPPFREGVTPTQPGVEGPTPLPDTIIG